MVVLSVNAGERRSPSERSNPAFRVAFSEYVPFNILFHVITASYLLGREQKNTAGSVSREGDSIFYSGISAVKSGSHVLKLYGD